VSIREKAVVFSHEMRDERDDLRSRTKCFPWRERCLRDPTQGESRMASRGTSPYLCAHATADDENVSHPSLTAERRAEASAYGLLAASADVRATELDNVNARAIA
jgi:hypothetical protein